MAINNSNSSTSTPPTSSSTPKGIDITIRTAAGTGLTDLSAFDDALLRSGLGNYNLLCLSSVIPPGSRLHIFDPSDPTALPNHLSNQHGDRLFCVRAHAYADKPGDSAWAGLGWVVDKTTGKGLFVEHSTNESEERLRKLLDMSLDGLVERRGGGYEERGHAVVEAKCEDREKPVCALAIAAYETMPWEGLR